jgi:hypothetical protein
MLLASEEFPKTISAAVLAFEAKCAGHAKGQVALTNEARRIGLLVQAWTRRDQITFGFYKRHQGELPKEVTYKSLKTFVQIARQLPAKVDSLADARKVWQQTFQTAGLLELPERIHQKPSGVSHYMKLVDRIGNVRNVLADWNRDEPFESWTKDTRAAVAGQLRPLADLYRQLTKGTP